MMVTDPACRMTTEPQAAAGRMEHRGVTYYYFCSAHCRALFTAHPERYRMKNRGGDQGRHRHGRNLCLRTRVWFQRAGRD